MSTSVPVSDHLNLVVLRGDLEHEITLRDLPSGGTVAQFDLTTRSMVADRSVTTSLPVVVHDPTVALLDDLRAGGAFVIVGRVKRRFFRVGGATQSRTEVVAESAIPARRRKQVARVIGAAIEDLTGMIASGVPRERAVSDEGTHHQAGTELGSEER